MGYPSDGATLSAGTLRIIGDAGDAECWLPLPRGGRGPGILAAALDRLLAPARPLTTAERQAAHAEAVAAEQAKVAELATIIERHHQLVATTTLPALTRLLTDHAPHVHEGSGHAECYYCGADGDTDEWSHLAGTWVPSGWPCGVWQTISDSSP